MILNNSKQDAFSVNSRTEKLKKSSGENREITSTSGGVFKEDRNGTGRPQLKKKTHY